MKKLGFNSAFIFAILVGLLVFSTSALADTVQFFYTDKNGNEQTLVIDEDSSEEDLKLAALIIFNANKHGKLTIKTTADGKGKLFNIKKMIRNAARKIAAKGQGNVKAALKAIDNAIPNETGITNSNVAPAPIILAPVLNGDTQDSTDEPGNVDSGQDDSDAVVLPVPPVVVPNVSSPDAI